MKRNRKTFWLFIIILLVYLLLEMFMFHLKIKISFWFVPVKIFIGFLLLVLSLKILSNWKYKLVSFTFALYLLFMLIPQSGLYKYSIQNYISKNERTLLDMATSMNKIKVERFEYFGCRNYVSNTRIKFDENQKEMYKFELDNLCSQINSFDISYILKRPFKQKNLYVLHTSFGSGFGLMYIENEETIDEILNERMWIYKITGVSVINKHWYKVTFG